MPRDGDTIEDSGQFLDKLMSENYWQGTVEEYAQTLGWVKYHTRDSRGSDDGFPDLVLVRPPRVIFVELKKQTGKMELAQTAWATLLADCPGVEHYVWRPGDWADVEELLQPHVRRWGSPELFD